MSLLTLTNDAARALHQIPAGTWQAILASGTLTPLLHVAHRVRVTRKEKEIGEISMLLISILVAFTAAVLQYLFTKHPADPKIIALHTAVLGFTMTPTYIILVKPTWAYLTGKYGEASQLEDELKSALVPAEGLPVEGTSVSAAQAQVTQAIDDFNN